MTIAGRALARAEQDVRTRMLGRSRLRLPPPLALRVQVDDRDRRPRLAQQPP